MYYIYSYVVTYSNLNNYIVNLPVNANGAICYDLLLITSVCSFSCGLNFHYSHAALTSLNSYCLLNSTPN